MKTPRMAEAMNYIDDDLVSGAITYTRKKEYRLGQMVCPGGVPVLGH